LSVTARTCWRCSGHGAGEPYACRLASPAGGQVDVRLAAPRALMEGPPWMAEVAASTDAEEPTPWFPDRKARALVGTIRYR
jgi:hypothetical protein